MSSVKCDVEGLVAAINQIGERATRGVAAAMVTEAQNIVELAKSNAPVDEGNLEDAIKMEYDRKGVNGRTRVFVYIDNEVAAGDHKVVGDYAVLMHEGLAPYGSGAFQLGPKSQEKAMAGHDVGGKFLERAAEERIPVLVRRVQELVRRQLK